LTHLIHEPREVYVEQDGLELSALEVVDAEGSRQIVVLKDPLMLPAPSQAMSPEAVAQEGLAALGRRPFQLCGTRSLPQWLRQLLAFNPALDIRDWPRQLAKWRKGQIPTGDQA